MKFSRFCLWFVVLFFGLIGQSWSDDGIFGGNGDTVFPTTKTKIQMVNEIVRLKCRNGTPFFSTVYADCDFFFKNPDTDTVITMGFPAEPEEFFDEDDKDIESQFMIRNFTVEADGQKLNCKLKKTENIENIKDLSISYAYLWKMKFPKNKMVHVHHSYEFDEPGVAGGESRIVYILRTGALWSGVIDKAVIELELNDVSSKNLEIHPEGYTAKDGTIRWVFNHFKPMEDIEVIASTPEFRKVINQWLLDKHSDDSAKELMIFRNEIFAQHGRIFKSKELQEYFSKQPWYRPNKNFSVKMLTQRERELLEGIRLLEENKKREENHISN